MPTDALSTAVTAHREALEAQRLQQDAVSRRNAAVRAAVAAGHSAVDVAAALNVNRQRVYQMLSRESQ